MSDSEDSLSTCSLESTKRTMTSAVPGMEISETRDALAQLRQLWDLNSPTTPFYACNTLPSAKGMSCSQFALLYVHGQIQKRNQKQK